MEGKTTIPGSQGQSPHAAVGATPASPAQEPLGFPKSNERQRRLTLAGTYNVRDLGGYATKDGGTTRWGVLLRADSLHRLTPEAQDALLAYGVRTILDLRNTTETEKWPNPFAGSERARYHHLNLSSNPAAPPAEPSARTVFDLEVVYRRLLDEAQLGLATVLSTLAEPGATPALVHCMAGKDRTGVVVALLLALAGVPHETIAADYALTSTFLGDEYRAEARGRAEIYGLDWEQYQRLLGCPPEYMLRTLAYLDDRHGGVERYLGSIGLADGQVAALRDALVE
jgi:protein-tyrosine phosphatase